jgi:hypothetical protein
MSYKFTSLEVLCDLKHPVLKDTTLQVVPSGRREKAHPSGMALKGVLEDKIIYCREMNRRVVSAR